MDICDKPLYVFINIIIVSIAMISFVACYYAATSYDECNLNDTMDRWLMFYGLYDFIFGINLMVLNQMYTTDI